MGRPWPLLPPLCRHPCAVSLKYTKKTLQQSINIRTCSTDRHNRSVYYVRPPQNGIASYACAIFCMIISCMELQYIVYMTVGLDFPQHWTKLDTTGGPRPLARASHAICCIAGTLTGQEHPCCWWRVDAVVVYSKTCGCWMWTEECGVRLVV